MKIGSYVVTKLRSENLCSDQAIGLLNRPTKLQLICHKKRAPFFAFSLKFLLIGYATSVTEQTGLYRQPRLSI